MHNKKCFEKAKQIVNEKAKEWLPILKMISKLAIPILTIILRIKEIVGKE